MGAVQQVATGAGMGLHSAEGMGKHMQLWPLVAGGVAASRCSWCSNPEQRCCTAAPCQAPLSGSLVAGDDVAVCTGLPPAATASAGRFAHTGMLLREMACAACASRCGVPGPGPGPCLAVLFVSVLVGGRRSRF
jgi:hypothetical protein